MSNFLQIFEIKKKKKKNSSIFLGQSVFDLSKILICEQWCEESWRKGVVGCKTTSLVAIAVTSCDLG